MIQVEIGQTIIVRNKRLVCLEIDGQAYASYCPQGECDAVGVCDILACRDSERSDRKMVYFKSLPNKVNGSSNLIEIPNGGTFTIKGVRYRAELAKQREGHMFKCGQCAFYSHPLKDACMNLQCVSLFRHDAKEIVFVKDGEE